MSYEFQIVIVIILGSILFLFLAGLIVASALIYKRAQQKHHKEITDMELSYKKSILEVQLEVQDRTLQHVSSEIHDNIGQSLSLVKLHLNTISGEIPASQTERLNSSKTLVSDVIRDLRTLSHSLNSTLLADKSLPEILQLELDKLERTGAFRTELQVDGPPNPLSPDSKVVLCRIVQEVIQNAVKHSKGTQLKARLCYRDDGTSLVLTDNGVGFNVNEIRSGTGLSNLRNRAELIGFDLNIQSIADTGTTISLHTDRT